MINHPNNGVYYPIDKPWYTDFMTVSNLTPWHVQVRQWLRDNERSQAWLSRKVDLDTTYFSLLLNGKKPVSRIVLQRLEEFTGLSFSTNGTENK